MSVEIYLDKSINLASSQTYRHGVEGKKYLFKVCRKVINTERIWTGNIFHWWARVDISEGLTKLGALFDTELLGAVNCKKIIFFRAVHILRCNWSFGDFSFGKDMLGLPSSTSFCYTQTTILLQQNFRLFELSELKLLILHKICFV